MNKRPEQQDFNQLRKSAEAKLVGKQTPNLPDRSAEDLLHELQVYQIELEMQNQHLREAYAELGESCDRYVYLYDLAPVGYLTLSREGLIEEANLTAANLLGIDRNILITNNFNRFIVSFEQDRWYFFLRDVQNNENLNLDITLKRGNDTDFYAQLNCLSTKTNDLTTALLVTLSDITLSRESAKEIQHLAFYDSLTHLPNRRLLMDRLKLALASSGRTGNEGALLFLDLDNFKTLNDTLGHDMGDVLLQQVAQCIEFNMREGDTVARMGGDEFVVMLQDLSNEPLEAASQIVAIGSKILNALNQPFQLATHEYRCSVSIGATMFRNHHFGADEILKQADIAMYQAKKAGRNALRFFDPEMQSNINKRVAMERELQVALKKSQFQLYYQMQVNGEGHIVGAEALIRWLHPEHGMVSPGVFIPLSEETGLILPIGRWVIETACSQLQLWQKSELTQNLTLSVNVSASQFHEANFVTHVQSTVLQYGVNPALLKLEPTESILLDDIEGTILTMNALRTFGVHFALDDFGTGFSSLQYLKKLPLNQLKIDQSFVRDLASDPSDQAIVRTIIAMAKSLNLEVIAEGVETEVQHKILQCNGCNHFQGYLFGKPMPIEQFETMLLTPRENCPMCFTAHN
jgi:diguanylate cyclase (GGDEF)-like protein